MESTYIYSKYIALRRWWVEWRERQRVVVPLCVDFVIFRVPTLSLEWRDLLWIISSFFFFVVTRKYYIASQWLFAYNKNEYLHWYIFSSLVINDKKFNQSALLNVRILWAFQRHFYIKKNYEKLKNVQLNLLIPSHK